MKDLADHLDFCVSYGWRLLRDGVLPEENREWREARLCEFLGLSSISEILAKPKVGKAA
jgi:hypothetical protein